MRIFVALSALYFTIVLALFFTQRALLFPAPRGASAAPPPGFGAAQLNTEDGLRLAAAYRPNSGNLATIVFFHGNGDSLAGADDATRAIGAAGYGLLLVEYRGYAGNPGSPGEQGLYRDGRAALAWLMQRGVDFRCIVVVGNSLGSGVATEIAAGAPVAGLVLVSGFTSMPDVVAPLYPWVPVRVLLRDRFDNRAKIRRVEAPILLLHGTADHLIPARHSTTLAGVARNVRLGLVPEAGHALVYSARSQTMILRWLAGVGRACRAGNQVSGEPPKAADSHSGVIASPSASVRRNSIIRPKSG
ncbi:alpha/beta hydrolase [Sphingomonas psychrotolerans]|uniref:alpha/beta hydrolase n=1 Tax=Sphingomonas psychrotolerans TaxID=1327635 RepID=UPI001F42D912|nr:alpha/beta hydrolase [Sphingomonas psychrotolerans]